MAYDPKQALIIQEGFVPSFYFDHLKKLTIGVGHLVQKGSPYYEDKTILKRAKALLAENGGDIKKTNALLAKDPFFQRPKEELMKVFDKDYAYMEGLARKNYPGFDEHPQNVQDSLVNMTFQLGNKPTRWPSFNKALKAKDYEEAAYHLADSDWFAVQTPNRAAAVIDRLAYGTEYVERPGEQNVNRTYMRDNVQKRVSKNPKHFQNMKKSGSLGEEETSPLGNLFDKASDTMSNLLNKAYNTVDLAVADEGRLTNNNVPPELVAYLRRGLADNPDAVFVKDGNFPIPLPEYFDNARFDGSRVVFDDLIDIEIPLEDYNAGDIPEIEYEDNPLLEVAPLTNRRKMRLDTELDRIYFGEPYGS